MRAILLVPAVAVLGLAGRISAEQGPGKLIVHEWGVQVRCSAYVKSPSEHFVKPGKGEANNVLGPPAELVEDLPAFVGKLASDFRPRPQYRNWNKPVIHLYGPEGTQITVRVLTQEGRPTAYWPKPKLIEETFWLMGSGVTDVVGLEWTGKLLARPAEGALQEIKGEHWWKTVRQVPGMYVQTTGGSERFIFYEAVAVQEPVVTSTVAAESLTIRNAHSAASGPVVVVLNDGAQRRFAAVRDIPSKGQVAIKREELLKADGDEKKLLEACRAQWASFGLTGAEANAIVETWRLDILDRSGFLIIARLPAELYDGMFPLTISPRPDELVRAGVVFDTLPGQAGRLNWLAGLKAAMQQWGKDLADTKFEVRKQAAGRLARTGDLARPILEELRKSDSAEVRNAAGTLLEQIAPGTLDLPRHGRGSNPVNIKRTY